MKLLLIALLLSGCGSACSSTSENVPEPASPAGLGSAAKSGSPATAAASKQAEPAPEPEPPPPTPVDPEDERVVYAASAPRTKVRFDVQGGQLWVADLAPDGEEDEKAERLSLQDMYGTVAWSHRYARIDDLALGAEGQPFAIADGKLFRYDPESGEPTALGEARGQLVLTPSHAYVHHLGIVHRFAREGGAREPVVETESRGGFHRIGVHDEQLVMLISAYRNRPARNPKMGWLFTAPADGSGELKERFDDMYSPGPTLMLDGDHAYFGASKEIEDFDYEIMRLPLSGRPELQAVVRHPVAIFAVEDEAIYAAARLDEVAGLYRFYIDDTPPALLTEFEGGATRIALDGDHVYWESRGRIYRVRKDARATPPEPEPEAEPEPEPRRKKGADRPDVVSKKTPKGDARGKVEDATGKPQKANDQSGKDTSEATIP